MAGDTVTVDTGTGTPIEVILSAADITAGSITPTLPTANIPASGTLTASVTVTDTAGNTGSAATDTSNVDTAAPSAPTAVSINDGDGLISDAERTAGVSVDITLPGDAVAGDTVTVDTGTGTPIEVILSAADITAGSITPTLPTANIPASGTLTASVTVTDTAGNTGSAATDTSNVDTAAPSAPTAVSINDGDGLISDAERTAGVPVIVSLPGDAVAGDTVIINTGTGTPLEVVLSAADITAGNVTATLPAGNIPTSGTVTTSTTIRDASGNTSPSASDNSDVDTTAPNAPVVTTPTNGAPVIGAAEPGSEVVVTTPSGATCTTTADVGGNYSCSLSPDPVDGEDLTVTATDEAGNNLNTNNSGGRY